MPTPNEKGDALEAAVHAIEALILRNSPIPPVFERRKIIEIDGVHHEIDLFVTLDVGASYKSIFIFECKNWAKPVGKNEVIIFSSKISDSGASKGFIVAREFTADAEAAVARDPRIIRMLAREFDPNTNIAPIVFYARFPEMTSLSVSFKPFGTIDSPQTRSFEDTEAKYKGERVNLKDRIVQWSLEACDADLMQFFDLQVPEGIYPRGPVEHVKPFARDELFLDNLEIQHVKLEVGYQVEVVKNKIEWDYEVESRGRYFAFAPLIRHGDTLKCALAVAYPQTSQAKREGS
jgi:hypothetical protein